MGKQWTANRRIYLDAQGSAVEKGDPSGVTLLVAEGRTIPMAQAEALGLLNPKPVVVSESDEPDVDTEESEETGVDMSKFVTVEEHKQLESEAREALKELRKDLNDKFKAKSDEKDAKIAKLTAERDTLAKELGALKSAKPEAEKKAEGPVEDKAEKPAEDKAVKPDDDKSE